jgi:hypothetical protein
MPDPSSKPPSWGDIREDIEVFFEEVIAPIVPKSMKYSTSLMPTELGLSDIQDWKPYVEAIVVRVHGKYACPSLNAQSVATATVSVKFSKTITTMANTVDRDVNQTNILVAKVRSILRG